MGNIKRTKEIKYILNLSQKEQKDLGFKYDYILEEYIYKFPVYKEDGTPTLFCKLFIDDYDHRVIFGVYDKNDSLYAGYYNRTKNNELLPIIDNAIKNEFKKLGVKKA